MKRTLEQFFLFVLIVVGASMLTTDLDVASAQVQPQQYANSFQLLSGVTTVSTGAAVRAPSANKTYQINSSVTATTGTTTVNVQGSNDGLGWDNIATLTVTSSVSGASTSTSSTDRYVMLRGQVTVLSGTGPTVSLTVGY